MSSKSEARKPAASKAGDPTESSGVMLAPMMMLDDAQTAVRKATRLFAAVPEVVRELQQADAALRRAHKLGLASIPRAREVAALDPKVRAFRAELERTRAADDGKRIGSTRIRRYVALRAIDVATRVAPGGGVEPAVSLVLLLDIAGIRPAVAVPFDEELGWARAAVLAWTKRSGKWPMLNTWLEHYGLRYSDAPEGHTESPLSNRHPLASEFFRVGKVVRGTAKKG